MDDIMDRFASDIRGTKPGSWARASAIGAAGGLVGLVVTNQANYESIGQAEFDRRLESVSIMFRRMFDRPALALPARYFNPVGVESRSWVVFTMVPCDNGQWSQLVNAAGKLRQLWRVDHVTLIKGDSLEVV